VRYASTASAAGHEDSAQAGLPLISHQICRRWTLPIGCAQDGRARRGQWQPIDLRLDAAAQLGEKVVIRILDSAHGQMLDSSAQSVKRSDQAAARNTKHLARHGRPAREDDDALLAINQIKGEGQHRHGRRPVIRMQGIVQSRCRRSGLTFAAALRSILRQDPNVVLSRDS